MVLDEIMGVGFLLAVIAEHFTFQHKEHWTKECPFCQRKRWFD